MKPFLVFLFLLVMCSVVSAQNIFKARIESEDEDPDLLEGTIGNVVGTQLAARADSNGLLVLHSIPDGEQTIEFSYVGYFKKRIKITFPQPANTPILTVSLQSQVQEVKEVVVTTTRNYEKAEYIPTRVETIDEEEVEERSHDKPADISHVLREQPGIQVQRISATAGNMGIRLEGLSDRYVQILKDGIPLFGGFSNVIGLTQIPPLDIQQVEIIKGPSSILYGSDAISGVINLVSKKPTEAPVYDVMVNGESALAFDAGSYASQKWKWFSYSLMAAYRDQKAKSWDTSQFTQTPRLQRYSISPQLYFDISKKAKLNVGVNYTYENRLGGNLNYIEGRQDTGVYYEKNLSNHFATNLKFEYDFGDKGKLTFINAFNLYNRTLTLPYYLFGGQQLASTSELNYYYVSGRNDVVFGLDFRTDRFNEAADSAPVKRNYNYKTIGLFAQYLYHFDENTALEAGLRFDYFNFYKVFMLPHLGALHKWNNYFSTRLNLGLGYKLPTIFQDESEEARFVNVQPIAANVNPEFSLGGTIDLKVKFPSFNGVNITINQLYFLTHILQPLLADTARVPNCPTGDCVGTSYTNGDGYVQSLGIETGFNLNYRGFDVSVIYTLADNHRRIDGVLGVNPLTSKHIISMFLGYEIKHFFIGVDCYYYSPVQLSDGTVGRRIWELGVNTQYAFKFLTVFANLENILNIKQTNYGPVVFADPTSAHPRFSEIYGPLEGRLLNVGVKLHLGVLLSKKGGGEVDRVKRKDSD